MTDETVHILAQALLMRFQAERGMRQLLIGMGNDIDIPKPKRDALSKLAETYVHEQRVINRIISEHRDA